MVKVVTKVTSGSLKAMPKGVTLIYLHSKYVTLCYTEDILKKFLFAFRIYQNIFQSTFFSNFMMTSPGNHGNQK